MYFPYFGNSLYPCRHVARKVSAVPFVSDDVRWQIISEIPDVNWDIGSEESTWRRRRLARRRWCIHDESSPLQSGSCHCQSDSDFGWDGLRENFQPCGRWKCRIHEDDDSDFHVRSQSVWILGKLTSLAKNISDLFLICELSTDLHWPCIFKRILHGGYQKGTGEVVHSWE